MLIAENKNKLKKDYQNIWVKKYSFKLFEHKQVGSMLNYVGFCPKMLGQYKIKQIDY